MVIALLVSLGLCTPALAATRAGNVSALLPTARIERGGAATDARRGADVQINDLISTNDQGRVRIKLLDHSLISIGVKSQLRIIHHDPRSRQTAVELQFGKLRAQVARITRAGGMFELRAPTAVAGVIGTDFGVDASDPNVTKFICISGEVRIASSDPKVAGTVVCRGGTTVTVRRGQAPDQPQNATPEQMETWKTITEPEKLEQTSPY